RKVAIESGGHNTRGGRLHRGIRERRRAYQSRIVQRVRDGRNEKTREKEKSDHRVASRTRTAHAKKDFVLVRPFCPEDFRARQEILTMTTVISWYIDLLPAMSYGYARTTKRPTSGVSVSVHRASRAV